MGWLFDLIARIKVDGGKEAEADLKSVKVAAQDAAGGIKSTAASFGAMAAAVAAANFAQKAFNAAVDYDSLVRSIATVATASDTTGMQLARLRELAKVPGLGFEEAIRGSVALQSVGLSAQVAERSLAAFANAAASAGKGKEDLQAAMTQVAQIISAGKLQTDELNVIADRIPQIRKVLKEAFGTSSSEEISKMGLTAEQILDKINTGLEKLPKATGGLRNALDNLKDDLNIKVLIPLGQIGAAVWNAFGPVSQAAIDSFGSSISFLQKHSELLAGALAAVGASLAFMAATQTIQGIVSLTMALVEFVKVIRAIGIANAIAQALSSGGISAIPAIAGGAIAAGVGVAMYQGINNSLKDIKSVSGGIDPKDMAAGAASSLPTKQGDLSKIIGGLKDGLPGAAQFGINLLAEQRNRTERTLAAIEKNTKDTADVLSLRKQVFGGSTLAGLGATSVELNRSGVSGNAPTERDYGRRPASTQLEESLNRLNRKSTNQILRRGRKVV